MKRIWIMKTIFLSLNKDIYIRRKRYTKYFKSYLYNGSLVGKFKYKDLDNQIVFSPHFYVENNDYKLQSIQLLSEILYFIGKKEKAIICARPYPILKELKFTNLNSKPIKNIHTFEQERVEKFSNINELYNTPHLVPWNLVEIEWDVLSLLKKYVNKNSSILEIGSGYGKNMIALLEAGYKNITGIEFSSNAYNLSKKFSYCSEHNINASIAKMPLASCSMDVVIDIGCLHCADEQSRNKGLDEIYRVLKNGGIIISRYFLPKDKEWIKKYPIKVTEFGKEEAILNDMFKNKFKPLNIIIKNGCFYFIGEKNV